jgi:hypothetical protein
MASATAIGAVAPGRRWSCTPFPESHGWQAALACPRSVTKLLGPQSNAVSANSVMWAFFMGHPLT